MTSSTEGIAIGPAMILDTATGRHVEPLAADLTPFLDWPLYFPDESVYCSNNAACKHEDRFDAPFLASSRRMTIREFLADVRAHAEGGQDAD